MRLNGIAAMLFVGVSAMTIHAQPTRVEVDRQKQTELTERTPE